MKQDFYKRFKSIPLKEQENLYEKFLAFIATGSKDFLKTEVYVNPDLSEVREIRKSFDYKDSLIRGILITKEHTTVYTLKGYAKTITLKKYDIILFSGENALHQELIEKLNLPISDIITFEIDTNNILSITMTMPTESKWYDTEDVEEILRTNINLNKILEMDRMIINTPWGNTLQNDLLKEWILFSTEKKLQIIYLLTKAKK